MNPNWEPPPASHAFIEDFKEQGMFIFITTNFTLNIVKTLSNLQW